VVTRWFLQGAANYLAIARYYKDEKNQQFVWYSWVDSNHRPPDPQFDGLTFIGFAGNFPVFEMPPYGLFLISLDSPTLPDLS
jgi:hypothetical protein